MMTAPTVPTICVKADGGIVGTAQPTISPFHACAPDMPTLRKKQTLMMPMRPQTWQGARGRGGEGAASLSAAPASARSRGARVWERQRFVRGPPDNGHPGS